MTLTLEPSFKSELCMLPPDGAPGEGLVAVHRATLRFCAARADLLALLALPRDHREAEARQHVARLLPSEAPPLGAQDFVVPPLGAGEAAALGYGALLHPWVGATLEGAPLSGEPVAFGPPEGAVAGLLAAQALGEGAWHSPGNVPLEGVLAGSPRLDDAAWARLAEARVNLVRRGPRGFALAGSDTLARESALRPIPVRRLLVLLRRLALHVARPFVFENNGPDAHALLRRTLEGALSELYLRGAFRGAAAGEAYRVAVQEAPGAEGRADRGELLVELHVAPAAPLEFLRVRLELGTSGSLVLEES